MRINIGKMIAGGVLAGVVLAIANFATDNFLLANEWQEIAHLHNIDPALMGSTGALVNSVIVSLALGQLLVLAYAAVRPRFGPGPGTAAAAGFLLFLPQALLLATFGGWFLSWDFYFRQSVVMMIATMAAGIAGAWVYSEEEV